MWMLSLWVLACASPEESLEDSGTPCAPGSHAEDGACVTTLQPWSAAAPLNHARDHHISFVLDGAVHVALGTQPSGAGATRSVERLDDDGWTELADWPEARIGAGIAPLGDGYVVAGGMDASGTTATDCWQIAPGMVLSACAPLNRSRYHVAMAAWEGRVYALGGLWQQDGAQEVEDTIEVLDGGVWTVLDPLPEPLTHFSLVAHDGALYVIGGGSSAQARSSILRAEIQADGSLGDFAEAGTLPEGRATASALVHNDQLYVLAGMTGLTGGEVSTVLRADLDAEGRVGDSGEVEALPLPRAHSHQAPLLGTTLYSIGGSVDHAPQAEVFQATLD